MNTESSGTNMKSRQCQSALWNLVAYRRNEVFNDPEASLVEYMDLSQCDALYNIKSNRDLYQKCFLEHKFNITKNNLLTKVLNGEKLDKVESDCCTRAMKKYYYWNNKAVVGNLSSTSKVCYHTIKKWERFFSRRHR